MDTNRVQTRRIDFGQFEGHRLVKYLDPTHMATPPYFISYARVFLYM